jgi:hypothetical protein
MVNDTSKEICIHQYDDEDKWSIEVYNNTHASTIAKRCGMSKMPSKYYGDIWEGNGAQMAYFFRFLSGETIRVPKNVSKSGRSVTQPNEALDSSPQEEKPRRRQKMKRRTRRDSQKEV